MCSPLWILPHSISSAESLYFSAIARAPPQVRRLTIPNEYLSSKSIRNKLASLVEKTMICKSSKYLITQLWEHWSNNLKNNHKNLSEIIIQDLLYISEGNFEDTWTSNVSFLPKENNIIINKKYVSFRIFGNVNDLLITIYGLRDDNIEENIYEINFNNLELMIHTYFSIQSLLYSRAKVKCLSDILNKTTISVIQPSIAEKTGNIIRKTITEFNKIGKNKNKKIDSLGNIIFIDNSIGEMEAEIDSIIFKLYQLDKEEINTIMTKLKIPPSYQQLVFQYFTN